MPNTGSLVSVEADGSLSTLVAGLAQPTSMEVIGNTAFVIALTGDVWRIGPLSDPPYGGAK